MEQLLWTYDDLGRFIDHPDAPVRRWALERLTKRFPDQAGEAMIALLDDPNTYIVFRAAEFLAGTGDAERYGPVLLDRLRPAQGRRLGYLAQALARLQVRDALPPILAYLQHESALAGTEFTYLVGALGQLGGDEAWQSLWAILQNLPADSWALGFVLDAALRAAQPADIPRVVQVYRSWHLHPSDYRHVEVFASAIEVTRLAQELGYAVKEGVDAAIDRAAWWLGQEPALSDECLDDLAAAFQRQHEGVFPVLLREAQRLVEERGDDVAGWQADWAAGARLKGYRRHAPLTLLILAAFAAHPCPYPAQRLRETAMGLALLCRLSIDHDDQATLDAAADQTEALLTILAENREQVLPDVVERVVDRGPAIVPRLVAMLDPDGFSWGMLRAVQALERLGRHHLGSCDAAIPTLIAMIHEDQSDFLKEACSSALEAIGPAVVDLVAAHLRDDDLSRQIYLTGVLGEIPTGEAAQAILGLLKDAEFIDEMHLHALANIGSPAAIEPLYALWLAETVPDHLLADLLLILCAVNGVDKPELPEWRRIVEAEEDRMARIASGEMPLGRVESPPRRESSRREPEEVGEPKKGPETRPARKPKTVSKQELKKRKARRKAQRWKGKKKRRR